MSPGGGWGKSRQLGSLIGDAKDVTHGISIASQAYGKMYSLWMRRIHILEKRKVRLYMQGNCPTNPFVQLWNMGHHQTNGGKG